MRISSTLPLQQIEKTKKLVDAGSVARGNLLQIEAQAAQEELSAYNYERISLKHHILILLSFLNLKLLQDLKLLFPEISVDSNSVIAGNIDEIYQIATGSRPEIKVPN